MRTPKNIPYSYLEAWNLFHHDLILSSLPHVDDHNKLHSFKPFTRKLFLDYDIIFYF